MSSGGGGQPLLQRVFPLLLSDARLLGGLLRMSSESQQPGCLNRLVGDDALQRGVRQKKLGVALLTNTNHHNRAVGA